ncbi:hypothetical protein BDZ91DRAFT_719285 [Kalaharituber pfeilii]|nr:hypothetical protein BDZ91DRAFT_719285 [Kalaharituber pfeilii]
MSSSMKRKLDEAEQEMAQKMEPPKSTKPRPKKARLPSPAVPIPGSTYIICKRGSDYRPCPLQQWRNSDLDRYDCEEGFCYSRPQGRVFAVFHDNLPGALRVFEEEAQKMQEELDKLRKYTARVFVETEAGGNGGGMVRALLARRRRKVRGAAERKAGDAIPPKEDPEAKEGNENAAGCKERKEKNSNGNMSKEDEHDDNVEWEIDDDDGQRGVGMVFMWIERWDNAAEEDGARTGCMLTKSYLDDKFKRRRLGTVRYRNGEVTEADDLDSVMVP